MCGIAGLIGSDRNHALAAVSQMTAALARRGPDGEGIEQWSDAVLGHRRLSIFDLSDAGRQPMVTPDRRIGVVFNGAIYNFLELRRDLLAGGFTFKSNTDTEVLLHGYLAWGLDELVSKLRGMFAFGLWDDARRKFFLVRDRLGVKPLIYSTRQGRLAFASTPRALQAAGVAGEIDPQAMAEYLEYGYVPDPRTIYSDTWKLPPASILEWSDGTIKTRQYWSLPRVQSPPRTSFEDAVQETERLFIDAVRLRLEADVPVGTLLSGGVDSSLVCWAVTRLGADITAFTVGTPGDSWDESADARETARELGIRHEVVELSPAESPEVGELVSAYGEPFACASALGMLSVSRAVKRSATVLLTGDGGDDVFLGYPEHKNFWTAQKIAAGIPAAAGPLWRLARPLIPRTGVLRRGVHLLDYATGGLGAIARAHPGLPLYRSQGMLGERLLHARIPNREIPQSGASARAILEEFLDYDLRGRFAGEYMTKVDGSAMHYALEARSPLLDQELWNFAATLPYDVRLRGGSLKAILREMARRNLGQRVATGRKRGFGIPVQRWIAGRWKTKVEAVFQDSVLAREGWINAPAVLAQLENAAHAGKASNQLWYLYVLESWLRQERSRADVSLTSTSAASLPM